MIFNFNICIILSLISGCFAVSLINPYGWSNGTAFILFIVFMIVTIVFVEKHKKQIKVKWKNEYNVISLILLIVNTIIYPEFKHYYLLAGIIIIIYGLSPYIVPRINKKLRPWNIFLFIVMLTMALSTISIHTAMNIMTDVHDSKILTLIYIYIMKIFGLNAWLGEGYNIVNFTYGGRFFQFIPSLDELGLLLVVGSIITWTVLISIVGEVRIPKVLNALAFLITLLLVKIVVAVSSSIEKLPYWRWSPIAIGAVFIILGIVFLSYSTHHINLQGAIRKIPSLAIAFIGLGIVFGFSSTSLWVPEKDKGLTIAIDEAHSEWEVVGVPLDTINYGGYTTYNYNSMVDLLQSFYNVILIKSYSDSVKLPDADVYILKTPTRSYEDTFCKELLTNVTNGAGLLAIGDHTNVFGMNSYLNKLLTPIKVQLKYDATYEAQRTSLTRFDKLSSLPNPLLTKWQSIDFATSCTVTGKWPWRRSVVGRGIRTLEADYSNFSYFPRSALRDTKPRIGAFCQLYTTPWHKGNVVIFTDSTIFSNFYMFYPGKVELLISMIEFARSYPAGALWRRITITLTILMLLCGFVIIIFSTSKHMRSLHKDFFMSTTQAISYLLVWLLVTGVIIQKINQWLWEWPNPSHKPLPELIMFDESFGPEILRTKYATSQRNNDYQTFYVWSQRLGFTPVTLRGTEIYPPLLSTFKTPAAKIIINPNLPPDERELKEIVEYVRCGGSLVIMDNAHRGNESTANLFLKPFNIRMEYVAISDTNLIVLGSSHTISVLGLGIVEGGTILANSESGEAILTSQDYGQGKVVAGLISEAFTTERMGSSSSIPNKEMRNRFNVVYWLYEYIINSPN